MTAACRCPVMPDVSSPIAGPIRCDCCGEPLELTCPKACVKSDAQNAGHPLAGISDTKKGRSYAPKLCALCHQPFTPTGPRSVVCDRCKGEKSAAQQPETPVGIAVGSDETEGL